MSADNSDNNQKKSSSSSDNKDKDEIVKKQLLVVNKLLQPVIPDNGWPCSDNLTYHKFESTLEDMDPNKYWKIAFTDKLESYQYKKLDMGTFERIGKIETEEQKNNAGKYGNDIIGDINLIRKRTVKVTPSSQVLGKLTSFAKGKENVTTFEYNTTQQKYGNKMQFSIKFDKFWSQYFPEAAGIVTVDYVDKEKHTGTKQIVELVAKINFGWNEGLWSYLGSAANSVITMAFKNMIQKQMQEMINLVPDYLYIAEQHKMQ